MALLEEVHEVEERGVRADRYRRPSASMHAIFLALLRTVREGINLAASRARRADDAQRLRARSRDAGVAALELGDKVRRVAVGGLYPSRQPPEPGPTQSRTGNAIADTA